VTTALEVIRATPYYTHIGLFPGPDGAVVLPASDAFAGDEGSSFVHGGVIAAFLEAAMVILLRSTQSPSARCTDFTTTFLRTTQVAEITARARILHTGRRFAQAEVKAWQTDASAPVAIGQGTLLL